MTMICFALGGCVVSRRLHDRLAGFPSLLLSTLVLLGLGPVLLVQSATAQDILSTSPDITIDLGTGVIVADEEIALDNQMGVVLLDASLDLPEYTDLTGLGLAVGGDRLFAVETWSSFPGGIHARPGDVIRFDGTTYTVEFGATAAGLPAGAKTDAVSLSPQGLLLSFDIAVDLGGGLVAEDEDLVEWNGSAFSLRFDGSAEGLDRALDVDAAHDLGAGAFLLSFDRTGQVGGVTFSDEDVLLFDGDGWSLSVDGSGANSAWGPADLDAVMVPEPSGLACLAFGFLMLVAARRFRQTASIGVLLAAVSLSATSAEASQGAVEINQTCAVATGCFAGDSPGFPVTLTEGGSYVLTGSLTLSGQGSPTSMIQISANDVTLDLGGFAIHCAGSGGGTCSGATDGISGAGSGITVRNGIVRGMPGDGVIIAGSQLRGVGLQAIGNGGAGLSLGDGSILGQGLYAGILVERSIASGNGGVGIAVGRESLVRGCVSRGNAGRGLSGTASPIGGFAFSLMSGYLDSVVQLNGDTAVVGLLDMGSNLCAECP
ncbi:MAG: hypothetical protein AB8G23_02955 [Myxococcota bacterium]